MTYKPCKEIKINKYIVLQFEALPTYSYKRLKIDDEIYDIVPTYDMKNCIVIEDIDSQMYFLNKEVEFIM